MTGDAEEVVSRTYLNPRKWTSLIKIKYLTQVISVFLWFNNRPENVKMVKDHQTFPQPRSQSSPSEERGSTRTIPRTWNVPVFKRILDISGKLAKITTTVFVTSFVFLETLQKARKRTFMAERRSFQKPITPRKACLHQTIFNSYKKWEDYLLVFLEMNS